MDVSHLVYQCRFSYKIWKSIQENFLLISIILILFRFRLVNLCESDFECSIRICLSYPRLVRPQPWCWIQSSCKNIKINNRISRLMLKCYGFLFLTKRFLCVVFSEINLPLGLCWTCFAPRFVSRFQVKPLETKFSNKIKRNDNLRFPCKVYFSCIVILRISERSEKTRFVVESLEFLKNGFSIF